MINQKREIIAATQHAIWSHWMRYLFSVCHADDEYPEFLIIPGDKVQRWKRQMETLYAALSEQEKESDREQADKVLAAIEESDRRELFDELVFALESTCTPFELVAPQKTVPVALLQEVLKESCEQGGEMWSADLLSNRLKELIKEHS